MKFRRDPRYGSGAYTFPARNLRVSTVAGRVVAGDSVAAVAKDFGLSRREVEAAVEWRRWRSDAAKRGWRTRKGG